jgi:hypothetical protein
MQQACSKLAANSSSAQDKLEKLNAECLEEITKELDS